MKRDIVVAGASAGGLEALCTVIGDLPADFPGSVFIVLHIPPARTSVLDRILGRNASLPVAAAMDGELIEQGRVYVATPDHHLVINEARLRVSRGPKENGHRPSVDTLFRSAAVSYGARVVGVVLSGAQDDGTPGIKAVKHRGGVAIIQDPNEASHSSMPLHALQGVQADYVLPVAEIGSRLVLLAKGRPTPSEEEATTLDDLDTEVEWAHPELEGPLNADPPLGAPSGYTCPECHGALWEIDDEPLPRYRCRVGHGYSAEALTVAQQVGVDAALWAAYRALEERAALNRTLAERAAQRGAMRSAMHFREQLTESEKQADILRAALWSTPAAIDRGES